MGIIGTLTIVSDQPTDGVNTYRVTFTHPAFTQDGIVDLIATTARTAAVRVRHAMFYRTGDVVYLAADYRVELLHEHTCAKAGHSREDCRP